MAADVGRNVIFMWNSAEVAGVRAKNVTRSAPAVNVTSDEDDGNQTLLGVPSEKSYSIAISGVTKSDVLALAWASGARTAAVSMVFPSGRTIEGQFYLQDYNEGAPYNDAITFDGTLLSTGAVTETPGS